MKLIIGIVVAAFTAFGVIDNIATVNRLKKEAAEAYQNGDFTTAIAHYQTLLDSLNVEDPNIRLNLAHSLIQAGDTISAQRNYSRLVKVDDKNVKSVAYQQMGVIASDQEKYKEALSIFKESLKADPSNEEARYNYELVKELLKNQEEQQQDQQNQDQQEKQDQPNQEDQQKQENQQQQGEDGEQSEENQEGQQQEQEQQQGESDESPQDPQEQNAQEGEQQQEGKKSDEEQSVSPMSDRLKEMNISEEKARMILEAMRNNEMQYIQQNRRRPENPRDRTKPDW